MSQLDLVVPGLCGPLTDLDTLDCHPLIADLVRLLSRADCLDDQANNKAADQAGGFHQVLSKLFGLDENRPLPSAQLCLLAQDIEAGEGHWLHADPVNLQADIDQAFLRDAQSLELEAKESAQLLNAVNQHFAEDGLQLKSIGEHHHWFINTIDHADIQTTALPDVIGRNVNFFLPQGVDHLYWKRFLNESQMLFHQSEVNEERIHRGLLPVNSLWLWGEGALPAQAETTISGVYTNNVLTRGLAIHHNIELHELDNVATLTASLDDASKPLVVLDELFNVSCYGDRAAWLERFEPLFTNWLQPLIKHAMARRIKVNLYPCHGRHYQLSPSNRFRLFRAAKLKQHIQSYINE